MSRLSFNGDDHAEAAGKHLTDARTLLDASRPDGAAYLAGYVAECALKVLILLENGAPMAGGPTPWRKKDGHSLPRLQAEAATLAAVAGAKIARYFGPAVKDFASLPLAAWDPQMRYRAPAIVASDAASWFANADSIYTEIVGAMIKDGVL